MQIEFEAEIKSITHKPSGKNSSEAIITLLSESYTPGDDWCELMNKNGKIVKVIIVESESEDAIDGMNQGPRI